MDEPAGTPPRKTDPNIMHRRKPYASVARDRIRAAILIRKLMDHVMGRIEMSVTQIRSAEILLRKVVPDLKQVDHTGGIQHVHVTNLTDDQLTAIAAGSSPGTPATEERAPLN